MKQAYKLEGDSFLSSYHESADSVGIGRFQQNLNLQQHSQKVESVLFGDLRIASLLFVSVGLLVSTEYDL